MLEKNRISCYYKAEVFKNLADYLEFNFEYEEGEQSLVIDYIYVDFEEIEGIIYDENDAFYYLLDRYKEENDKERIEKMENYIKSLGGEVLL